MSRNGSGKEIYFDSRWLGAHGIGRYASEVLKRLGSTTQLMAALSPTHPLDVMYLTFKVVTRHGSVWYSPGYNAPLFRLRRYVFTIHDLNHIDIAANSSALKRLYYQIVLRRACRRAARVLTVSEFSRRRIIEWSGVDPARVVNVGNGVSADFSVSVAPYRPGYPYLLSIGNRKGHKNELRLLKAFATAKIDASIKLLFSGPSSGELLELASEAGVSDRIVFLGRIEERALPSIYRGAIALAFPSLYEGFGLPVLEAMASGIPVITSNTTALPEVAGDAAILVDPENVAAIADAIGQIVHDETLRTNLTVKGLERVRAFSWDSVAYKVKAVLDEVLEEKAGC
ncbi:MAG TPA: glycosyltransferase family 1 protein [Geobacteraceae bacterium]